MREPRASTRSFLHESRLELRKVAWLSRAELRSQGGLVALVVLASVVVLALLDAIYHAGITALFAS